MQMNLTILEYVVEELSPKDLFKQISLAQLERLKIDLSNNFTRVEQNGVVVVDHSQTVDLYGKIVSYCVKNLHLIMNKYQFPRHYTYGQVALGLIEMEILKKIN